MIKIKIDEDIKKEIKEQHYLLINDKFFDLFINEFEKCFSTPTEEQKAIILKLKNGDEETKKKFFTGEILELEKLKTIFGEVNKKTNEFFFEFIEKNYKNFRNRTKKWGAYKYSKLLGVRTCPYCNMNYIYFYKKMSGNGGLTAQIDYYYSKDSYPYLGLSIFNLIPCCSTCNQIKSSNKDKIEYPLINEEEFYFDEKIFILENTNEMIEQFLKIGSAIEEEKIILKLKTEFELKDIFSLKTRYDNHRYEIKELLIKNKAYSDGYLKNLSIYLKKISNSPENGERELKELIFGSKIEPLEYKKKILSKFMSDILEDLNKI